MPKVAFHTLGCRVNQYETEAIKKRFMERGFEVVGEEDPADVYVVNTCTVTGLADRKSRQYIRRMRRQSPHAVICATGCYVQAEPEQVAAIEELDVLLGTNEKYRAAEIAEDLLMSRTAAEGDYHTVDNKIILVDKYEDLTSFVEAGDVTSPDGKTRANIKIQEGCNRFCTYCIIPYARGPVRSRERDNILAEARALVDMGYRELVLTGINTALYEDLPGLLADLDAMPGDFRIRLASLEPTVVDAPFVANLLDSKRLCHQLHLALQSGSDRVLAAMNRHYTREDYMDIVKVLRDIDPLFNITTDIIVGFPGETDEDFADTMDLARRVGFGKIHAFKYSKRPGTPAAKMPDQAPEPVKKQRSRALIDLGEELAQSFLSQHVGTAQRILLEEREGEFWTGYTDNYVKAFVPAAKGEDGQYLDMSDRFVEGTVQRADEKGVYLQLD